MPKKELKPLDFVVPDQFLDRTRAGRKSTFFEKGIVAHVAFAEPVSPELCEILYESARTLGLRVHQGGTYVNMEGPQFSTRAESNLYRQWGADVIGMTNLQEAKLAREAEICYATLALSTDYDCWHETHDDVTVDAILEVLRKNVALAKKVIKNIVLLIEERSPCDCHQALKNSIITDRQCLSKETMKRLSLIVGKYFEKG